MKKRVWIYVAIGFLGIAIGVLAIVLRSEQAARPIPPEPTSPKPQQAPKVSLPGASPIEAIHEDYNQPSSLWVVVNKQFALADEQYRPSDLELVTTLPTRPEKTSDEQSLRQVALPALDQLVGAANAAGHNLLLGSGFRGYDLQAQYFNNYAAHAGEAAASQFSARPGQSEHQTGLAVDFGLVSGECYLETCFGDLPAGQWLAQHAHTYGFILRYPADKTEITGYQYEPWHFRYVGVSLATALYTSGLTLDQAQPYLKTALEQLRLQQLI